MPYLWWNHKTHWMSNTKFYRTRRQIQNRCYNKNLIQYNNYWWRWIKCARKRFEDFYEDMYESFTKHNEQYWWRQTSIDRIDVNWDYCKENCKWSTLREQCNNRTSSRIITYKWETHTLAQRLDLLWIKDKRRKNNI